MDPAQGCLPCASYCVPMKIRTFLKSSLSIAALSLVPPALANVAPEPIEMHVHLAHEDVHCDIKGDEAVVTGTFIFDRHPEGFNIPVLYLPVYAVEGTPVKQMMPTFTVDGRKLKVHFVEKSWENNHNIKAFGQLPQIEGQRVYWFYVSDLPSYPVTTADEKPRQTTLKIRYTQKLSNNKFIYTPLIPNQKKDKDYGSITVSADRPLRLLDAEKHSYEVAKKKLIIDPSDKRGIIVEVAKPVPKIP